jgi:hypothetical protein
MSWHMRFFATATVFAALVALALSAGAGWFDGHF